MVDVPAGQYGVEGNFSLADGTGDFWNVTLCSVATPFDEGGGTTLPSSRAVEEGTTKQAGADAVGKVRVSSMQVFSHRKVAAVVAAVVEGLEAVNGASAAPRVTSKEEGAVVMGF